MELLFLHQIHYYGMFEKINNHLPFYSDCENLTPKMFNDRC